MAEPTNNAGGGKGTGLAPNVASLLCYLFSFVSGIAFLVLEKDNKEIKFHAWQAIFLGIPLMAFWVLTTILISILPLSLWGVISLLSTLLYLGYLLVMILCMVKAYQGEKFKLPFIGDLAEQQANK